MLIAGKIDGIMDLLMFLWVSARGMKYMGVETLTILSLVAVLLLAGAWYFLFRSREA